MDPLFADRGELSGTRALVVDDLADSRELLASLLEMCGMTVFSAASGNQAFPLFQQHRPHIILSDVWMPDGDGCELMRRIRALSAEEGGLTPAIAISGGASADQSLEAGFHHHFTKPVEPLALIDCVRDFVTDRGIGRAQWTVTSQEGDLVLKLVGHVTSTDIRAAVSVLARALEASPDPLRVVVDFVGLTGFDPSMAAAGQVVVWRVRRKILGVRVVGGSAAVRLVTRTGCLVLGLPYEQVDAA